MWLFDLLFSSIPQNWYVEVRISRSVSESPLDFEITRVGCSKSRVCNSTNNNSIRDLLPLCTCSVYIFTIVQGSNHYLDNCRKSYGDKNNTMKCDGRTDTRTYVWRRVKRYALHFVAGHKNLDSLRLPVVWKPPIVNVKASANCISSSFVYSIIKSSKSSSPGAGGWAFLSFTTFFVVCLKYFFPAK